MAEAVKGAFIKREYGQKISADVGVCAGWDKLRLEEKMLFVVFLARSEVGFEPVYCWGSPAFGLV